MNVKTRQTEVGKPMNLDLSMIILPNTGISSITNTGIILYLLLVLSCIIIPCNYLIHV